MTLNTYSWKNNLVKKRNIAMFSTFLFTGLRKGELLGLRLDDVDLEKKELRVRAETSKSRRQRLLPIHGDLCKILLDYLDERNRVGLNFMFTSCAIHLQ
ncbi:site-specific integrase [Candidatus Uhrbacteria bacterium]|nr:site-specific integrase [Candidatus Uhrbacteria bacterium]